MQINFLELVKSALIHMGCGDRLPQDLDPHAPVELHFASAPTIVVEPTEENTVHLRARLSEHPGIPSQCAALDVIEAIAQPAPWTNLQCVSLLSVDGYFYLHVHIHSAYLRDEKVFSEALAEFYDRLMAIHKAFQG